MAKLKKKFYFVAAGYFRFFANFVLRRWNPEVIAVTGSVGKTTMLHLIEFELGDKAHYSHDANSAFGIAFDLVNLRGVTGSKFRWLYLIFAVPLKSLFVHHSEKYYVVEIDGERPHETEFLASWLKPKITLWISLGRSHAVQFEHQVSSGEFEDLDRAITHEFAMLPEYTRKKIYIDGDSYLMKKACEKIKEKNLTDAEVIECKKSDLKSYSVFPDHTDFQIKNQEFHFACPQPEDITIQLIMLKNLCRDLDIPLKSDFTNLPLPPGRCSYFAGKNGLKLVDSSYNAHLISMAAILDLATKMQADHKWLVLGDIVDQGSREKTGHEKLAELIKNTDAEKIILIGRRTCDYTAPKLKRDNFPSKKLKVCKDVKDALSYIEKNATGKETLIFKGSQYLEWLVEKLLENPADAEKLCRREPAAMKRKKNRGLV
ncbi:MAG: cyanophycin synthetase [Candidatus Saccharibacteria bacterium]|nr:cyanophycin synthetase [Candidatus Saccharibacteria bacterium]